MPEYIVPEAALNIAVYGNAGMPYRDLTYCIPCKRLEANVSRFHFTDQQIVDAAIPQFAGDRSSIERWSHYPAVCGIYFLVSEKKIIYVGMSNRIPRRIFQHRDNMMPFDSLAWFEAPEFFIKDIESYYIHRIEPPMNTYTHYSDNFSDYAARLDAIGRKPSATQPAYLKD